MTPLAAIARFALTVALGPAIGVAAFLVAIAVGELILPPPRFIALSEWQAVVTLGYLFGLIPAALGAGFMAVFAIFNPASRAQLVWSVPLGAVAGVLGVHMVLFGGQFLIRFDPFFSLTAAFGGALALLVCTLLFFRLSLISASAPAHSG